MKKMFSKIKYSISSNKGNAMVLTIVVLLVLLIIMLVGVTLLRQQTKLVSKGHRKSEALSVAEAGLDAAIWRLERNQTLDTGETITGSNTQGNYSVTVELPAAASQNNFYYRITSEGTHTGSSEKKKIVQDVYYINMSQAIFTYSGTNGGGQTEGSINVKGPFYTSGDLNLSGTVDMNNLEGTTGNPMMVRGNLYLNSNGVDIGTEISPMAVFVKGDIKDKNNSQDRTGQVHDLVSKNVPEVNLPEIVKTQFLDAAQGNDNAVYIGDLTLGSQIVKIGKRDDLDNPSSYSFYYNGSGSTASLTTEGVVYIDGDLTFNKDVDYQHGSYNGDSYSNSTIFTNGQITINDEIHSSGTYPANSVLALVNEDSATTNDIYINISGGNATIEAFLYCSGQITINKQVEIHGTLMAKILWLNQVPDLRAPDESAKDNYPYLFPAKDLAFLITTNWREVSAQ